MKPKNVNFYSVEVKIIGEECFAILAMPVRCENFKERLK